MGDFSTSHSITHPDTMKSFVLLAVLAVAAYAEPEVTDSGLAVEYINKPEEGPTPVNVFAQIDADGDKALTRDEISGYLKQQVESMQSAGGEQGEEARKMLE